MKFDVVVGNPPYQDSNNTSDSVKLWNKIALRCTTLLKDSGYIALVTPNTVIAPNTGAKCVKKPSRILQEWIEKHKFIIFNDTVNNFFDVNIDLCYWIVQNLVSTNDTKFIFHDTTIYKRFEVGERMNPSIADNIIDKVINSPDEKYKRKRIIWDTDGLVGSPTPEFYREIIWNTSDCKFKYCNKIVDSSFKLAINNFKKFEISDENLFITESELSPAYFYIQGQKEDLEKIQNILSMKLFKFVGNNFKNSTGVFLFAQRQNVIPILDISKNWSDEEIFERFELTQEEINYILENTK